MIHDHKCTHLVNLSKKVDTAREVFNLGSTVELLVRGEALPVIEEVLVFDPSEADLAAIEAEWPVIEAELAVVAAECRLAATPRCALARHAWRRAVKRLGSVARAAHRVVPDPCVA